MVKSPVVCPHISQSVDIIRGAAALGVIWGHAIYGLNRPIELNGAFWVWVFLPVSGYLVARGFDDGGYGRTLTAYGRFLWNRSLRIVPLAWLALAIGAAVAWAWQVFPPHALRQMFFMPPTNDMSLVGPLWTIAAEMQFYVFAVLVVPFMAMRPSARLAAGLVLGPAVVWGAQAWIAAGYDNGVQPRTLFGNLPFFMFGIWLASLRMPPLLVNRTLKALLVAAPIAVAWYLQNYQPVYFWQWRSGSVEPFGWAAVCALAVTMAVLWVGVRPAVSSGVWAFTPVQWVLRACAWCGFYTYGIYVMHAILTVFSGTVLKLPPGPGRLLFLLLAVPLAPLSYRVFERTFLRFRLARA